MPDELTVTGDRLRLVIGDTVRNCFTTKILPPDVVVIEPILFWLNACDVRILPVAVIDVGTDTVSVTIFGTVVVVSPLLLAFNSFERFTARTFSNVVGAELIVMVSGL